MFGTAGGGLKSNIKSPQQKPSAAGKSLRAQQADEKWEGMEAAGGYVRSSPQGFDGFSNSSRLGGRPQLQFATQGSLRQQNTNGYDDSNNPLSDPVPPPRPQLEGRHAQEETAFRAYHNYHNNNGPAVVASSISNGHATAAEHADRARVLEEDFFPLRQRGRAQQMVKEMRDPNHLLSGGANSEFSGAPMNGPGTYTYTGGFASSVFSSSTKQDLTEEEQRDVYRQRHRQAYSALASVKPFLQRLFEDEDVEMDSAEAQQRQAATLAAEQQQRLLGLFGSEAAVTEGGVLADGGLLGGGTNNNNGLAGLNQSNQPHPSNPNIRSNGQPTGALQRQQLSKSQYGSAHAVQPNVYAKQPMASAINALPSWSYEDLVRRESAKPLILNTVVTTDRCPLTTKTCPPTYTTFSTFNYTADTKDSEAFSYFSHVAATGSGTAAQAKQRARRLGGSTTTATSRMNHPMAFSADRGAAEEPVVVNGTLQYGSLNVGLRVFRDFLLPQDGPLLLGVGSSTGRSEQKDERSLLADAHLAHLKRVIHDSKPVSERNHLAPAIDYDRW